MSGDDQVKGWRDYRRLLPTAQLNDLLRRSDDSGWVATRELLAQMGWTNLNRVVVITGDTLGRGIVYVLLPDETVACLSSEYRTYETCSVQEFADWDVQYAEPLWDAVVWLRYQMRHLRECTRALRASNEPKWRALKAFVESEGFDPGESVVAELGPDQFEEIGEFVAKDRRRFIFEIPYKEAVISRWDEEPPISIVPRRVTDHTTLPVGSWMLPKVRRPTGSSRGPTIGGTGSSRVGILRSEGRPSRRPKRLP
jgi:hypothetical protein